MSIWLWSTTWTYFLSSTRSIFPAHKHEIEDVIGIEAEDAPLISAKQGIGIEDVLEAVVEKIPAPVGDAEAPLQALIFDSLYDSYRGVIVFCRIRDGVIRKGMMVRMMATGATAEVVEVGYFGPGQFIPCDELAAGQVGYFTASIKNIGETKVGDTVNIVIRRRGKDYKVDITLTEYKG